MNCSWFRYGIFEEIDNNCRIHRVLVHELISYCDISQNTLTNIKQSEKNETELHEWNESKLQKITETTEKLICNSSKCNGRCQDETRILFSNHFSMALSGWTFRFSYQTFWYLCVFYHSNFRVFQYWIHIIGMFTIGDDYVRCNVRIVCRIVSFSL